MIGKTSSQASTVQHQQSGAPDDGGGNNNNFFGCCFRRFRLKNPIMWRTYVLRIVFVTSLLAASIICAIISYFKLRNLETSLAVSTYESIAQLALDGAEANMLRRLQGGGVMAKMMSFSFPDADQWPYVSFDGFTEINRDVGKISASTEHSLIPFVRPEQVGDFETFARGVYQDHGYPMDIAGVNEFGFGIWKFDFAGSPYDDKRVHDTDGITDWGSPHQILTPVLHVGYKSSTYLLLNGHQSPFFGGAHDSLIDCAEARLLREMDRVRSTNDTTTIGDASSIPVETIAPTPPTGESILAGVQEQAPCSFLTDIFPVTYRPDTAGAGIIYSPIYPKNDPFNVVGMIATTVFWEDILFQTVPSFVEGLIAVISTETQTYTFEVSNGKPTLLGEGDLHDPAYKKYEHSIVLEDFETDAVESASYILTVYPSKVMFNESRGPLAVALGFLGVIVICTFIFLLYDFLMRYEVRRGTIILEVKRRFVRFVSHEIRTPLNTVCMGLELLEAELQACKKEMEDLKARNMLLEGGNSATKEANVIMESSPSVEASNDTDDDDEDATGLAFCSQVTQDISENAECAVVILNDLLNYDKMESGTLKLEIETVRITELLEKCVRQFDIQASNRKVQLSLEVQPEIQDNQSKPIDGHDTEACRGYGSYAIGDGLRLGQCLRNVISNALKFTPPDGTIHITARHISNGLPHAKLITIDGSNVPHPLTKRNQRRGAIEIKVKDSGVGLSKDQLKLLFGEGVQFDANKLQHGGGSGLGLAITKGLIEQHQGTIRADSEGSGCGTTFTIELPLFECEGTTECSSDAPEAGDHGENFETFMAPTNRRILVVEDVLSSRKMLVRLLERSGHTCATAANGELACRAIEADMAKVRGNECNDDLSPHVPFDTILMDFEMPELNGPDAAERIRTMGFKEIIFGVTGNLLQEDVDHFKSKGATDVLGKPISMKDLNNHWDKWCHRW